MTPAATVGRQRAAVGAALLGAAATPLAGAAVAAEAEGAPASAQLEIPAPAGHALRGSAWYATTEAVTSSWAHRQAVQQRLQERAVHYRPVPTSGGQAEDRIDVAAAARRLQAVLDDGAEAPRALLADIDRALDALESAEGGRFTSASELAAEVARARSADGVTIEGPGDKLLTALFSAHDTRWPEVVDLGLRAYQAVGGFVDRGLSQLPDLELRSPWPMVYDRGATAVIVPPGARLRVEDGQVSLIATDLLVKHGGVAVIAQEASLELGHVLDGLRIQRVNASGEGWSGAAQGLVAGLSRDANAGILAADRLDLDLEVGRGHASGARIELGTTSQTVADRLSVDTRGFSTELVGAKVSTDGRSTQASLERGHYRDGRTELFGADVDLQITKDGLRLSSEQANLRIGELDIVGSSSVLTARPLASGGHSIELTGDVLGIADAQYGLRGSQDAQVRIALGRDGQLTSGHLEAGRIDVLTPEGEGRIDRGQADLRLDPKTGALTRVTAQGASGGYVGDDFAARFVDGAADITRDALQVRGAEVGFEWGDHTAALGGDGRVRVEQDDTGRTRLEASAGEVRFSDRLGAFSVEGGRLSAETNRAGTDARLEARGRSARYVGALKGGDRVELGLERPTIVVGGDPQGELRAHVDAQAGHARVGAQEVALQGLRGAVLTAAPGNQLDRVELEIASARGGTQDRDLRVAAEGIGATYARRGRRATLDLAEVSANWPSEGLRGHGRGLFLELDPTRATLTADELALWQELDGALEGFSVTGIEVRVDHRTDAWAAEAKIDDGEVRVDDVVVHARRGDGLPLKIAVEAETGIARASLDLPTGGEVTLDTPSFDATLSQGSLRFEAGRDGVYRAASAGVRGQGRSDDGDTFVELRGGDAEVWLDAQRNLIVLEDISGASARVVHGPADLDLTLDLERLRAVVPELTERSGAVEGFRVALRPDGDRAAPIRAQLEAEVAGVPVRIELDDVRHFAASAELSTNQLRLRAADELGHGKVVMGLGPVQLQSVPRGDAEVLDLTLRYHPVDDGRLLDVLRRQLASGPLFEGVRASDAGVLSVGTRTEHGFGAQLDVLGPSRLASQRWQDTRLGRAHEAPGAELSLGWRQGDSTYSAFAGVTPASQLTAHLHGEAKLGLLSLPTELAAPTSWQAGLRYDRKEAVQGLDLTVKAGWIGHAANLVSHDKVREDVSDGAFVGATASRRLGELERVHFDVIGTYDDRGPGGWIGVRYEF